MLCRICDNTSTKGHRGIAYQKDTVLDYRKAHLYEDLKLKRKEEKRRSISEVCYLYIS